RHGWKARTTGRHARGHRRDARERSARRQFYAHALMQLSIIAALLAAGMITGAIFPGRLTSVFGAATLYVFLPALIFEGAWRLDSVTMRRMWGPIAMLAVPGVFCTAGIIAVCVHYGGGVPWA